MFKFLFKLFKKTPALPSKLPSILSPVSVLSFSIFKYPYVWSSPGVAISGWLQSAPLSCFSPLNHFRPMWDHSLSVPKSMWVLWLPWWTITPLSPETRRTDGKYQEWESERRRKLILEILLEATVNHYTGFKVSLLVDVHCIGQSHSSVFPANFLQIHVSFPATGLFWLEISSKQHQQPTRRAAFKCVCCIKIFVTLGLYNTRVILSTCKS